MMTKESYVCCIESHRIEFELYGADGYSDSNCRPEPNCCPEPNSLRVAIFGSKPTQIKLFPARLQTTKLPQLLGLLNSVGAVYVVQSPLDLVQTNLSPTTVVLCYAAS